jgi:hypothetical protein
MGDYNQILAGKINSLRFNFFALKFGCVKDLGFQERPVSQHLFKTDGLGFYHRDG